LVTTNNYELALESCDRDGYRKKSILIEPRLQLHNGLSDLTWLSDNRLVYSLAEAVPNDKYDNLWSIRVDPPTGNALGAGTQITHGNAFAHFGLSASKDAKRMVFGAQGASETRAFVAPLDGLAGKLGSRFPLEESVGKNGHTDGLRTAAVFSTHPMCKENGDSITNKSR